MNVKSELWNVIKHVRRFYQVAEMDLWNGAVEVVVNLLFDLVHVELCVVCYHAKRPQPFEKMKVFPQRGVGQRLNSLTDHLRNVSHRLKSALDLRLARLDELEL